ncbi:hypothetical protein CPB85DRAFT_1456454 [Mucidula mucida]|nr:hypothetical protein CPB85DRAFT_1456454 [Mucidula mucida]
MPRKLTPSLTALSTTSVTPPRARAPLPRLIREGPNGLFMVKPTSPVETGKKRPRQDTSTHSVLPPKKRRTLKESSNSNIPAIPDLSSVPNQKTFRSHPRFADYIESLPRPVRGGPRTEEQRKKNLASDWTVAEIAAAGPETVRCIGCWNDLAVKDYHATPWVRHRQRCSALMAKWMVKEGFVTEEAAREAGIQFEQPELEEATS